MKKEQVFLSILLMVFLATRLPFLGSGLNVLEPDEEDYREIAVSASRGWPLYWEQKPYFEKFPLFIYLGFFIDRSLPLLQRIGPYIHLRLISVAGFFGLSILFFKYIKEKNCLTTAFVGSLFFLLNPLMLFYSRQGTYEIFYLFFGFLFFYFFEKYKTNLNYGRILLLSAFLALAVLAKHINILLFILPLYGFLKPFLSGEIKKETGFKYFLLMLASAFLIIIALLPAYFYSKSLIFDQFVGVPRQFFIKNPASVFAIFWQYLKISPFWLSWPILIGGILGTILSLKKIRENFVFLLVIIAGCLYINSYYINPRSYIFIVPYLMIGFSVFLKALKQTKIWKPAVVVLLAATLVQAKTAFDSTRHNSLEISLGKILKNYRQLNLPVYSTFEEDKLSELSGLKVRLLDRKAQNGGIILTDKRKTELMLNFSEPCFKTAKEMLEKIEKNAQPAWKLVDDLPHFPGTNKGNEFRIYVIN